MLHGSLGNMTIWIVRPALSRTRLLTYCVGFHKQMALGNGLSHIFEQREQMERVGR